MEGVEKNIHCMEKLEQQKAKKDISMKKLRGTTINKRGDDKWGIKLQVKNCYVLRKARSALPMFDGIRYERNRHDTIRL